MSVIMGKIIKKDEFSTIREDLRTKGKKIAQCHGVYDLVHIGHIEHFREAKSIADVLVVTVTAAKYVRKGPDRPFFDDTSRLQMLAEISSIDYVMLSDGYTGEDVIEIVQPDFWVKGCEYEDKRNDITRVQDKEVALVRSYGGDIYFTRGRRYSSTYLLNKSFTPISDDLSQFLLPLKDTWSIYDIEMVMNQLSSTKVLVIGDTIVDEYVYCLPPRNMSKERGYSTSILRTERSLGGCLAIANHAAAFSDNVTLMTVAGEEVEICEQIKQGMKSSIRNEIVVSPDFATIVKRKYIVENEKRHELHKLFSINNIKRPITIPKETSVRLEEKIKSCAAEFDIILCCDFGHGVLDSSMIDLLSYKANVLSVNCQTNATNYGFNLITKYPRADMFTLDQKELALAVKDITATEDVNLSKLQKLLKANACWLTRGSDGAYGMADGTLANCPAVSTRVVDTIGAGDAFYVSAVLSYLISHDIY